MPVIVKNILVMNYNVCMHPLYFIMLCSKVIQYTSEITCITVIYTFIVQFNIIITPLALSVARYIHDQ